MKKLLLLLALLPGFTALHATGYVFENFDVSLLDASGQPWSGTLTVELSAFSGSFTPVPTNLGQWSSSWIAGSSGYYDSSGPEWSAELLLADNAVYTAGTQVYLWAFDSRIPGETSQWVLLTDPSWLVTTNAGDDNSNYMFAFSANTTAIVGSFDLGSLSAATAPAVSAVPEPATWTALSGLFALGLAISRRRRRRSSIRPAALALPLGT